MLILFVTGPEIRAFHTLHPTTGNGELAGSNRDLLYRYA